MIELAFGESPGGALKMAKSMKPGQMMGGALGIIGGTAEERREAMKPRAWTGLPMEGSSQDVEALTLMLDIGDISDTLPGADLASRKKLLNDLFAEFAGVPDEIWHTNQKALARLAEAQTTLEPVRMWIGAGDPEERCALYFVCSWMSDANTPLSIVQVPDELEQADQIIHYCSIGEIPAEQFGALVRYEQPLSTARRNVYANFWHELVRGNAPLRAVINGKLLGVPEDFYDFTLRANIPEGDFRIGQLIGRALGQTPGVGDRWLFRRIQVMLRQRELVLVAPSTDDHPYSGVIRRST